jgi:nitrate/nitrite-specific signal transduction histidine kinase
VGATSVSSLYGDIIKMRVGESGSLYLLDGQGRVIYHSDSDFVAEDFSEQSVAQQVLSGQTGAVRTRSFDDEDIVAAFAPVPGTSWGLVSEESWAGLTSGSQTYQRFLSLLLILGVALPALVVAFGVQRVTRPVRELIDAAQAVARGSFGRTISAETKDEIGELAEQFNLMSSRLAETYTNLEQRVAERTKELAALNAIATVVSGSRELDTVLSDALGETLAVTGLSAGGIYLVEEGAEQLRIAATRGVSASLVEAIDSLNVGEGLVGQVAATGEPIVVKDLENDSRLIRTAVARWGYRSGALVPLVSRARVLGSLFVMTRNYHEFSEQDVELLVSIGRQLGVTVENAQLFAQVEQRMQELEALYRADEELYRHLELAQLLQTLIDVAVEILEADKGALLVWDDAQERLVVRASRGFRPETLAQMSFGREQGTVGRVISSGDPIVVEDVQADDTVARRITDPEGIRSFMHFPIKIEGRIFGVFNVDYSRPRGFGHEEQRLFAALAQRAALAIENAQLYGQAKQVAVLEERQRLARELHDAVTQTLFSASLIAEVLPRIWQRNPDQGRQRLAELHELTKGALAEMRSLLLELRPSALEEAELGDLLQQLADSFIGRSRVPVALEVEAACRLPVETKVALYRIAQEALNNVAKHAGAAHVSVRLACEDDGVTLQIRDDGAGFDPSDVAPERLGLEIMQERAAAIGAAFTVDSQPGHGTQVTVVWQGEVEPRAETQTVRSVTG